MRSTCFLLIGFLSACAHAPEPARGGETAHTLPEWRGPEEPERTGQTMSIEGLSATLNAADVRQVMERRQEDLLACLGTRGRRPALFGEVRFAFLVRSDGRVRDARVERSTLGHRGVEQCLVSVARRTHFPAVQGSGEAELSWTMLVDDGRRPPRELDGSRWRRVTQRRGRVALQRCEITRGERIQITAHLTSRGAVTSVGGGASEGAHYDLDCILDEVQHWRLPRPGTPSKLTFDLKT